MTPNVIAPPRPALSEADVPTVRKASELNGRARTKPLPLSKGDLENLRASGLSDETLRANDLHTEMDSERLSVLLNRDPRAYACEGGLVFPYVNLNGEREDWYYFARVRPHNPRMRDGDYVKYEHPKGEPLRAYFPKASLKKLRDGISDTYLTEGEKKALALSQLDLAAVGLGGVWCWKTKGTDELIPDLRAINWTGRVIYIVFDYDPKPETRLHVDAARRRLARGLRKRGAKQVYAVMLPPGADDDKMGVDDFLVAHVANAFRRLVKQAQPVPLFSNFSPLTAAKGRTDINNAARLVVKHGERTRWVGTWDKFMIWTGTHWQRDQALAMDGKAKDVAADLFTVIAAAMKDVSQ